MAEDDGPVWDGEGEDPFIPDDVPSYIRDWWNLVNTTEETVYNAWWQIINDFLTAVAEAFGSVLDATVAFMFTQQFTQNVDEFIDTTMMDVWHSGYDFTTDTERVPSNAALSHAQNRARTRRNQLVQFPNEAYEKLTGLIQQYLAEGLNPNEAAREIKDFLRSVDTPYWRNRAVVVARTETIGALNGGRFDAQNDIIDDTPGITWVRRWIATDDRRTRPTHNDADNQTVAVGVNFRVGGASLRFPGDPLGPPEETIQCRCTTVMIEQ